MTGPPAREVGPIRDMNVLVLIFALLLCMVNAVLWTVYTQMPLAGAGWVVGAIVTVMLRKWSFQ